MKIKYQMTKSIRSGSKDFHPFSPREVEVLHWLKSGKTSWDMSVIMKISERTVNYHVNNIMHKLNVINRPQAVSEAARFGLTCDEWITVLPEIWTGMDGRRINKKW
jgi:DNA-binding CsgD family transcriptional regulator